MQAVSGKPHRRDQRCELSSRSYMRINTLAGHAKFTYYEREVSCVTTVATTTTTTGAPTTAKKHGLLQCTGTKDSKQKVAFASEQECRAQTTLIAGAIGVCHKVRATCTRSCMKHLALA